MKKITKEIELYKFEELPKKTQEKVISEFRNDDYDSLNFNLECETENIQENSLSLFEKFSGIETTKQKNKFTKENKYSGVIINPNFKKIYWKHLHKLHHVETFFKNIEWYVTWDVASGAVWNSNCVQNLKLIYKKEDGLLVPLQHKKKE